MSAFGYKRMFSHLVIDFCFAPECGQYWRYQQVSASDPKRTFSICIDRQLLSFLNTFWVGEGAGYPAKFVSRRIQTAVS